MGEKEVLLIPCDEKNPSVRSNTHIFTPSEISCRSSDKLSVICFEMASQRQISRNGDSAIISPYKAELTDRGANRAELREFSSSGDLLDQIYLQLDSADPPKSEGKLINGSNWLEEVRGREVAITVICAA